MAADQPYSRAYAFGAIERRGLVGSLRGGQVALLGGASVAAVLEMRTLASGVGLPAALFTLAAAVVLAFLPLRGRTVEQWLPIAALWLLRPRMRSFRSRQPASGVTSGLDGRGKDAADAHLPEPLAGCRILSVPVSDGHEVGVFHDAALGAVTGVLAVRVRAFGLLGEREQERRLERWGRVLASLARNDRSVRLAVLERTVPADGDELQRYLVEARDRDLPALDPAARSYEALLRSAGEVTEDHELFVALQVDERQAATRAGRGEHRGERVELACSTLVRELTALAARFDPADVVVEGVLNPRMLARAMRLAFDPYGRERLNRLAVAGPEMAGIDPGAFGPLATDATWDTFRTDSAFHRTYWIAQWPRLPVGPAFLSPLLLSAQVVRSVAVTIEPVPPDRARRAVEAAVTAEEADEQLRTERGFRTTARRRKQHQAALRRERELADGHQEVRFAGYVTVSARDADELELACEQVEQAAHQAYLDLQPMWGQQDVAFMQGALPIARGLRPAGPLGGGW